MAALYPDGSEIEVPSLEGADLFKTDYKKLNMLRGIAKRRITIVFKLLEERDPDVDLTSELIEIQTKAVEHNLSQVSVYNENVLHLFEKFNILEADTELFDAEILRQETYAFEINNRLAHYLNISNKVSIQPSKSETSSGDFVKALNDFKFNVKPPPLKCEMFEDNVLNRFQFRNFLLQFENIVGNRKDLNKACKMTYLVSYLQGKAFNIIKHLSISEANYEQALNLLKVEFLDVPFIINDSLLKLISIEPKDFRFESALSYLTEVKALVSELANYNIKFLDNSNESADGKLLGCIIFSKLPNLVRREIINKVLNSYPSLNDIFKHYNEIIKILIATSKGYSDKNKGNSNKPSFKSNKGTKSPSHKVKTDSREKTEAKGESLGVNFSSPHVAKPCKLCSGTHSMLKCEKYPDHKTRMSRCIELTICALCSSNKHTTKN
jgi:hypothetical protein